MSRNLLEHTLQVRGFNAGIISDERQSALLTELFIRENLLLQADKVPTVVLTEFNEKLQEHRRNQLARLTLDTLAEEGMPDFSRRARELYEVRKQDQYQLPLRLRVRILRQSLNRSQTPSPVNTTQLAVDPVEKQATIDKLDKLLTRVKAGELDFKQAVLQYSDDPKRTLNAGDSLWFQRGQKAAVIFSTAEALSAEQALSGVVVHENHAYILQFLGRQEPVQQSFAEVKEKIIAELQADYRDKQRKLLLAKLRERFQNDTEIHPDFQ